MGAAVNALPPPKYKTVPIFAKVCVCGSQVLQLFQWSRSNHVLKLLLLWWIGTSVTEIFCCVCLSFVQSHQWQKLVQLLPGLLQFSAILLVTWNQRRFSHKEVEALLWKVLGVRTPLWGETSRAMPICSICPRRRWWQSFKWNYSNLEWGSTLFTPFPTLAFPPRGKQPAKWLFANSANSFSRRSGDEVKVVKHTMKERTSFCWRSGFGQHDHMHQNE